MALFPPLAYYELRLSLCLALLPVERSKLNNPASSLRQSVHLDLSQTQLAGVLDRHPRPVDRRQRDEVHLLARREVSNLLARAVPPHDRSPVRHPLRLHPLQGPRARRPAPGENVKETR